MHWNELVILCARKRSNVLDRDLESSILRQVYLFMLVMLPDIVFLFSQEGKQ